MEILEERMLGYKKSKIGLLPVEWDLEKFDNCTSSITCGVAATPKYVSKENGIPFLSAQNVNNGKLRLEKFKYVSKQFHKKLTKHTKPEKGDILYTRVGAGIGEAAIIDTDLEFSIYVSLTLIKSNDKIYSNFLKEVLNSSYYRYLAKRDQFAGGGVQNLNVGEVKKFLIPIPPKEEQLKIAEILSTWDQAIEKTQKLIDQLELRKKGLMQDLLSGKKRLPGFDGEWKELKAGKIFENHSNKNHNGDFEVLSATQDKGVIPRSEVGIDIKYDRSSLKNYKKVDTGDFVISLRSFQGGIEYSSYEGLVSPAYTVLKEKLPIAKKFYTEYLKSGNFINRLNSVIYGIRDGKQISYKEFSTLRLWYPPIEEQEAIAAIFKDADDEIRVQRYYLESLKSQKKGLMQQLLTGKKRVTC